MWTTPARWRWPPGPSGTTRWSAMRRPLKRRRKCRRNDWPAQPSPGPSALLARGARAFSSRGSSPGVRVIRARGSAAGDGDEAVASRLHVRVGDVLPGRDVVPDVRRTVWAGHPLTVRLAADLHAGVDRQLLDQRVVRAG